MTVTYWLVGPNLGNFWIQRSVFCRHLSEKDLRGTISQSTPFRVSYLASLDSKISGHGVSSLDSGKLIFPQLTEKHSEGKKDKKTRQAPGRASLSVYTQMQPRDKSHLNSVAHVRAQGLRPRFNRLVSGLRSQSRQWHFWKEHFNIKIKITHHHHRRAESLIFLSLKKSN